MLLRAILLCFVVFATKAQAQTYVLANPLEWMALAEGNEQLNGEIKSETEQQLRTAVLQNTMSAEFTKIHEWESKYSQYLQTAEGYASTLKAATTLYHDGVGIFVTLARLSSAIKENPSGIIASMSMNNLYMETAAELVSVFNLLKEAVAVGGTQNMLNGAERSQTLWTLQDKLHAFSQKLRMLYMSIRYYTLSDVWDSHALGVLRPGKGAIAEKCKKRWKRAAKSIHY